MNKCFKILNGTFSKYSFENPCYKPGNIERKPPQIIGAKFAFFIFTLSMMLPSEKTTLVSLNSLTVGFTWIWPEMIRAGKSSFTTGSWAKNLMEKDQQLFNWRHLWTPSSRQSMLTVYICSHTVHLSSIKQNVNIFVWNSWLKQR